MFFKIGGFVWLGLAISAYYFDHDVLGYWSMLIITNIYFVAGLLSDE